MTRRIIRCRTVDRGIARDGSVRSNTNAPAVAEPVSDINKRVSAFWGDLAPDAGLPPSQARTADGRPDINEIHRRFWADQVGR
ncbi:hypothetical protein [Burkholderia gladioli]|uniref:hypothetical protein n=1 Tax=Burkholderia gladioli TaxID=28095 RepID=UPI003D1B3F89